MKRSTILGLVVLVAVSASAPAAVISGQIDQLPESQITQFGDGDHDIVFFWSIRYFNEGFCYGSANEPWWPGVNADVAIATGVTDVSQITNASQYQLVDSSILIHDAFYNANGIGDFVVCRNVDTGHYGVLRIDFINYIDPLLPYAEMDCTWWFQSDGTGDFSSVPEPTSLMLLGLGLLIRRR